MAVSALCAVWRATVASDWSAPPLYFGTAWSTLRRADFYSRSQSRVETKMDLIFIKSYSSLLDSDNPSIWKILPYYYYPSIISAGPITGARAVARSGPARLTETQPTVDDCWAAARRPQPCQTPVAALVMQWRRSTSLVSCLQTPLTASLGSSIQVSSMYYVYIFVGYFLGSLMFDRNETGFRNKIRRMIKLDSYCIL